MNTPPSTMLDKLWDDGFGGPQPDRGLEKLRKIKPLILNGLDSEGESSGVKHMKSISLPPTPRTPTTPTTPMSARKANVWRSVFNPGRNLATKTLGSDLFDKPQPNSPTVYDWLYSSETKSSHR